MLALEDHGMLIWEVMTQHTVSHTGTRKVVKTQADYNARLLEVMMLLKMKRISF